MANGRLSIEEKNVELTKYRDLVMATLDYYLEKPKMMIKTSDYDSSVHFKNLKLQTEEHFAKGRLSKLKQWFRDLTEMQIETVDLEFNKYLKDKTKYDIDIFKSYYQRIDKVIEKGKITTDNQFYDINIMVDQLCQTEPVENEKMEMLNKLLGEYEQRKSQKTRKTNA